MRRLLIWRSLSGVFGRAGEFLPVTPFRHCEFLFPRHCESLFSRHCEERSDEAISPIAPPCHCEPKGWQVCWREAISSLHIPVGVRRSGGIASPDCYQARNDVKVACNGNFSQVNKEKELKKNKIINQQKLNAYGD